MAYQPPLNGGRINASMAGNMANAATLISTGTLVLSGGNNITLSQNGQSIGISAADAPQGSIRVSAGANSASLSAVTFSNSNGVSFGLNAGTITGSHNGLTSQSNQAFSAQGGSSAFQTLSFSNANGFSFSNNAGQVVGSYTVPTVTNSSLTMQAGASTLSSVSRVAFGDGNGVSFGASTSNNGSITITGTVATTYAGSNHSHGNPTLNLTNLSGTTASASNGLTLSLSANAQSVQTQGVQSITLGGNSTSAGAGYANISSGQMTLAGGNNITLSQNGNAVTVSAASQSVQTQGINGFQAGTQQATAGTINFANSNGMSFGMANSSLVTASHNGITSQTNQEISAYAGSNTYSSSSGTLNASSMRFVGSGNVSVGVVNGSVMISGAGGGGGGVALSGAGGSITSGTASISAGGALTATFNGQTLSLNAPTQSNLSATGIVSISNNGNTISIGAPAFSAGVSNLSNDSGNTGMVTNRLVLAGGNNITLSQSTNANGATVSISGGAGGGGGGGVVLSASNSVFTSGTVKLTNAGGALTIGTAAQEVNFSVPATSMISATGALNISTNGNTISMGVETHFATMWYPYNEALNVVGQMGQGTLGFAPVPTPSVGEEVQVNKLVFPLYFTNSSNSTGSLTVSFWMGLYTRTLSSISLAHSTSGSASLGYAGNNFSSNQRGIRLLDLDWATTIDANRYIVGIVSRSTTAGTNASLSQVMISQLNSNVSGMWDVGSNASVQWPLGLGLYSTTTSGMPSVVAYSQIRGTNSLAARPPSWHMIYNSA